MLAPLPYAGSALSRSVMIKTKNSPKPPNSPTTLLFKPLSAISTTLLEAVMSWE
jgi:hypothetical protein